MAQEVFEVFKQDFDFKIEAESFKKRGLSREDLEEMTHRN